MLRLSNFLNLGSFNLLFFDSLDLLFSPILYGFMNFFPGDRGIEGSIFFLSSDQKIISFLFMIANTFFISRLFFPTLWRFFNYIWN